jgi:tripartite-type tricarboxylate transporter receptor subunit TctC
VNIRNRPSFVFVVAWAASLFIVNDAPAQSFPDRPVRLVVPYPPGGTVDILARALSEGLTPLLKQPVIVDNRPGAGGTVAAAYVAKSPGDGYTLFVSDVGPLAIARSGYKNLPYDTLKDFAPVTIATVSSLDLAIHPSVGVKTVKDFIALAKSKRGQINFASSGVGSVMHLAGELFNMMAGVELVHVPYKGGAGAVTALMGGEVAVCFSALPTTLPFAKAGKVKIMAITMDKRSQLAPELATISEAGVPGYNVAVWQGVVAPATTPRAIVAQLNASIIEALKKPDIHARLTGQGFDVVWNTPEEFAKYIRSETEKWEKVVKSANIVME